MKYGVLIVDDSALMRRTLKRIIEEDRFLYVVDTARDGDDAVDKARELHPDVISMDINMPGLDGITALQIVMEEKICPVVMVSSLTQEGALTTFECLELGAFDFVAKPGGTVTLDMETVARELVLKLRTAARSGLKKPAFKASGRERKKVHSKALQRSRRTSRMSHSAVAIGISTGGPKMIFQALSALPANLNASVFMVQHMPPGFTASYAERLNKRLTIPFVEAQPGMKVEPGMGYLAQGGRHLKLHKNSSGEILIRCANRPESQFIPSVDVMMESVLAVYGDKTIGVLMTGMGSDGAESMLKIREAGGVTIAESEESAIVFGMPQKAIELGGAEIVAPIWDIGDEIIKAVNGS